MRWADVGVIVVGAVIASGCGTDAAMPPSEPIPTSVFREAISPGDPVSTSIGVPATIGALDLGNVPEVSVPMALTEHLNAVQWAVRQEIGDGVFGGAELANSETRDVTITILATDAEIAAAAIERFGSDVRDRIFVGESQFSVNALEQFAHEARRRLDDQVIEARIMIGCCLDRVGVVLVTPDGAVDVDIEREAVATLAGLPVELSFSGPLTPFGTQP